MPYIIMEQFCIIFVRQALWGGSQIDTMFHRLSGLNVFNSAQSVCFYVD